MISNLRLFDAHFHIIDNHFPLIVKEGFLPDPFTSDDYLNRMNGYSLCGGAIVSGSFQGFDQTYLLDALKRLGPSFVGVTQLSVDVSDSELIELNSAGVRAIRFNLKRGGSEKIRHLKSMATRVHEVVGWHVELYIDSDDLVNLYQVIVDLPAVSIDHLGLSSKSLNILYKLADHDVHIKVSGFGRVEFNVRATLSKLYDINNKSLMFGTDLPSTRAAKPYKDADYSLVVETLESEQARNVLYDNAIEFYNPKQVKREINK